MIRYMTRCAGLLLLCMVVGCGNDNPDSSEGYVAPDTVVGQTTTLDVPAVYTTIQAAVDAANSGDMIRVAAGTYTEHITVKEKALSLRGAGTGATVVYGTLSIADSSEASVEGFSVYNGQVLIERSQLRMSGNEVAYSPGPGLQLKECPSSVVSDNTLAHNAQEGIVLDESDGVIGSNTVQQNGTDGIVVNNASPTLLNNIVSDNGGDGISIRSFTHAAAPLLLDNSLENNGGLSNYDIICFGGSNPTGSGNEFERCINCEECRSFDDPATYDY